MIKKFHGYLVQEEQMVSLGSSIRGRISKFCTTRCGMQVSIHTIITQLIAILSHIFRSETTTCSHYSLFKCSMVHATTGNANSITCPGNTPLPDLCTQPLTSYRWWHLLGSFFPSYPTGTDRTRRGSIPVILLQSLFNCSYQQIGHNQGSKNTN